MDSHTNVLSDPRRLLVATQRQMESSRLVLQSLIFFPSLLLAKLGEEGKAGLHFPPYG